MNYAALDITSMRLLHNLLPRWNYYWLYKAKGPDRRGCERYLWELDQHINDRGYKVDIELAEAAVETIEHKQKSLAKKTQRLTAGEVERATQRDKFLNYIITNLGVTLPDLTKATLERRLNDPDIPRELKELIAVRLETCTTSTSKYKKLLKGVAADGTLKATLQFDGAARTRRWAGRLFQPQNLPRPQHKQDVIDQAIEDIKAGGADLVHDDLMALTSSCLRGVIVPREGRKLVVTDLSNIEGRMAAWICGEEDKLEAFRAYDRGVGPDLYVKAYSKMFGVSPEHVGDSERQIGKVTELMLGYGGGVGAFLTGALSYGIDLEELASIAWPTIPETIKNEARQFLAWTKTERRSRFGLSDEAFLTCDALKRLWRLANPNIASFWKEIEDAVHSAIHCKGKVFKCRKVKVVCNKAWLRVILPSGFSLCYPAPKIDNGSITYLGLSTYTRQWKEIKTYGGKLLENICQSGARDVMAWNMPTAEAENYHILLTVHDELITEAPDNKVYGVDVLSDILSTQPDWAPDLPLSAGGFEGYRYRKD